MTSVWRQKAEPVDIAEVVHFLCSESSNYITGENILVTGGVSRTNHSAVKLIVSK